MKKLAIIFGLLLVVVWFSKWRSPESASFVSGSAVVFGVAPGSAAVASSTDVGGTESQTTESFASLPAATGSASDPAVHAVPVVVTREPTFVIDSTNQDVIRTCLGGDRIHYGRGLTLENVIDDLTSKLEPLEVTMNVHVRRPGGREQRLHVEPSSELSSPSRWVVAGSSVRVYDVDKENLPVAVAFPKTLRLDSLDRIVRDFSDGSEVTFRERRSHERLSETATADIIETNGHINQLQLFADDASLGCAWQNSLLDCRCL